MPLHPQVLAMRDAKQKAAARPLYEMTLQEARAADLAAIEADRGVVTPVASVRELSVPGADGQIPARLYRPDGDGPFGVLVYFFGGGWTLGNLDTSDAICRQLCVDARCLVVSVGYRTAPEHRFPAAPHDCYSATRWVATHAPEFGGDPARLVVGGDSAGGNLAAAVTLQARDGGGPELAGQLLVYPNVDYQADTASLRDNDDPLFFNRRSVDWYWKHYLNDPADGADPLVSPLRAESLKGLPPALVITAEYDPLRDEGERYAARLQRSGVPVRASRYEGMIHGFFAMSGALDDGARAMGEAADFLRGTFAGSGAA